MQPPEPLRATIIVEMPYSCEYVNEIEKIIKLLREKEFKHTMYTEGSTEMHVLKAEDNRILIFDVLNMQEIIDLQEKGVAIYEENHKDANGQKDKKEEMEMRKKLVWGKETDDKSGSNALKTDIPSFSFSE